MSSFESQTFKVSITAISVLLLITISITVFAFGNTDDKNDPINTIISSVNTIQDTTTAVLITQNFTPSTSIQQSTILKSKETESLTFITTSTSRPAITSDKTTALTVRRPLTESLKTIEAAIKKIKAEETTAEKIIFSKTTPEEKETKNPENNADDFSTLSAYKNTDNAISELTPPDTLELDENGVPVDYEYCIEGKATAYTGDPATASGRVPMPGHIAVDPNEIPYGTELYVVSADGDYVYGYCIAADTGGFVSTGNTDIDLYMDNEEMCYDWGNRPVKIYVL